MTEEQLERVGVLMNKFKIRELTEKEKEELSELTGIAKQQTIKNVKWGIGTAVAGIVVGVVGSILIRD